MRAERTAQSLDSRTCTHAGAGGGRGLATASHTRDTGEMMQQLLANPEL